MNRARPLFLTGWLTSGLLLLALTCSAHLKLSMEHRQHIYLVLKEAINNLVKYSRATQAILRVSFDQHTLELLVKDNGKGFDNQSLSAGNGIPGMQRRADLIGAQLSITSAPGQGTEIRLKVRE